MKTNILKISTFIAIIVVQVFLAYSCKKEGAAKKDPEACFTFSQNGAIVNFNSSCSKNANAYDWDFGNGSTSIGVNPTHEFSNPGTFNVTLKITADNGSTNTTTKTVTVSQVCKTCTCTILGTSSSSNYCGTQQQVASFCSSCNSQSGGGLSCNCN